MIRIVSPVKNPKNHHPLLAVLNCLFKIFTATLDIWRLSPISEELRMHHGMVIRDPLKHLNLFLTRVERYYNLEYIYFRNTFFMSAYFTGA
jgi:hypothetical protein